MTDNYSIEDGVMFQGFDVGICQAATIIYPLTAVTLGLTTVANCISVVQSSLVAQGMGVAMKYGVTGDYIPVLFYGIAKMFAGNAITAGQSIISGTTQTGMQGYVIANTAFSNATYYNAMAGLDGTGTAYILGKCLQNSASGDYSLCLINPI